MAKSKTIKKRAKAKERAKLAGLLFPIPKRSKATGEHVRAGQGTRAANAVTQARKARERVYGLTKEQALDPMAGYPLGRAVLLGIIDLEQHERAYAYADADRIYRRLEGMPAIAPPAVLLFGSRGRGLGNDPDPAIVNAARDRYFSMRETLVEAIGRNGMTLFDNVVLSDMAYASPLAGLAVKHGLDALRKYC